MNWSVVPFRLEYQIYSAPSTFSPTLTDSPMYSYLFDSPISPLRSFKFGKLYKRSMPMFESQVGQPTIRKFYDVLKVVKTVLLKKKLVSG